MSRKVGFVPRHLQSQTPNQPKKQSRNDTAALADLESSVKTASLEISETSIVTDPFMDGEPILAESGCGCGSCGAMCGPTGGGACGHGGWCGPMLYGRVEYLLWATKGMDSPPLVTSSLAGTAQDQAGVLGQTATSTLFGGDGLNNDMRSGGRFTLGMWVNPARQIGIEFTHTALEEESQTFAASNFDETIVARPFFNSSLGEEDSRLIAFPALVNGNVDVVSATEFQTFDISRRRACLRNCNTHIDYFLGYRYAELKDYLRIDESTISLADPTTDTTFQLFDQFKTQSEFFGSVTGFRIRRQHAPCWSVELLGKFGIGNTRSRLSVAGSTTTTTPDGDSSTRAGGLLTQPSNIGSIEDNEFSGFSEIGVSIQHQLWCGLTCSVGYSFMYWSDVLRAGNAVDSVLNPTQIPPNQLVGEARPEVQIDYESFYAQGLRLGFEFAY
ncbi:MAG: BBP7 family outer membrane beta-barrel protein [Planctomycetales bacterium]|nr:BBP7 family outer membrane beta-barrel protein [Planctomycetales bacterium]